MDHLAFIQFTIKHLFSDCFALPLSNTMMNTMGVPVLKELSLRGKQSRKSRSCNTEPEVLGNYEGRGWGKNVASLTLPGEKMSRARGKISAFW